MLINNYNVGVFHKKSSFSVETKTGDSIRVKLESVSFILGHPSGEVTTFKRHKHQGRWLWSDSRTQGSVTSEYIVTEMARMLFGLDRARTTAFITYKLQGIATL